MRLFASSFCVLLLVGCSPNADASADDSWIAIEGSPEDGAEERHHGETYAEYDSRREGYDGSYGSFAGYGCTQDCSGHKAGYLWAEEKEIADPDHCGGKSWSFIEGCRAYAEGYEARYEG